MVGLSAMALLFLSCPETLLKPFGVGPAALRLGAEALATGETIQTDSAFTDDRFNARESVRARAIEAVLCAPIGGDAALGVLYLQGKRGAGPFSQADRELAELYTRLAAEEARHHMLYTDLAREYFKVEVVRERLAELAILEVAAIDAGVGLSRLHSA